MIKIKRITEFPHQWELSEIASREMDDNGAAVDFVMKRSCAWLISSADCPLFVCGVLKLSLVGGPTRLWFAGFEGLQKHKLAVCKFLHRAFRHMRRILGELSVVIDNDCRVSKDFAYHFGFVPTNHIFREGAHAFRYCVLR